MELTHTTLEGATVRLVPLAPELFESVAAAALSNPEIWKHIPYPMATHDEVLATLRHGLALQTQGAASTHVTCLRETGEVVGGTSIRLVDAAVPSVEIGGTWVVPRWQRTAVNTEAKRLQLAHCFETLGCQRVELKADVENTRSRVAIARLGARQEGVLRSHMRRANRTLRDSVLFSILAPEWPAVRTRLEERLAQR